MNADAMVMEAKMHEYIERAELLHRLIGEIKRTCKCDHIDDALFCAGYEIAVHQILEMLHGELNRLADDYADSMKAIGAPASRESLRDDIRRLS